MDSTKTRNMCATVDAIDFILHHEDSLTATEKKNLTDPLNTSRTVFRRLIGKLFAGYEVRKNAYDYSIRCADPEQYKALRLYNLMHGRSISSLDKLATDLRQQLDQAVAPLDTFFNAFNGNCFSYRFRDENRFFIYVKYMPYTDVSHGNYGNVQSFNTHSMHTRLTMLTQMHAEMGRVTLTPVCIKFMDFIARFSQWSLGYLPRSMGPRSVTEEFLDYALAAPAGENLQSIGMAFMRQRQATQQPTQQPVPPVATTVTRPTPVAETPRVTLTGVRPAEPTLTLQGRFAEALNRAMAEHRTEPEASAEAEATVDEAVPQLTGNQDVFNAALARISGHSDERHLLLDLDDIDLLSDADRAEDPMSEEVYLTLLSLVPHFADSVLPCTVQDIADDFDTELHGVYFMVDGAGLKYLVYFEGSLSLETEDYAAAVSYYSEHYGQPEQIRYLEEISYVRN